LFSAYTAERLFKIPRDMGFSLLDAVICGPYPRVLPIL